MSTKPITDEERFNRLRLLRSDNIGAITWHRLVERFGSATASLDALPDLRRRGGSGEAKICSAEAASRELATATKLGMRMICHDEPGYPVRLAQIEDSPPLLYVLGNSEFLARPAIAIVGARNASANGRRIAFDLARDLARTEISDAPLAVVSGFARGIDTAAHDGALAGPGATIAVMAGGADIIYPRENSGLFDRIVSEGAIISELPPGIEPRARHFPRRNRIVSGCCAGVVVVEAAARSGSLITARLALEQGREVFAVPGSPRDPRCRGTNALIRSGATLTETAADITDVLAPMIRPLIGTWPAPPKRAQSEATPAEPAGETDRQAILDCLSPTPVTVDEIVRQCQVTASVVQTVLLELELAGRVERQPGNRVAAL